MRIAVIAAGTNSCRLLIVRRDESGLHVEHHDIRATRLGEGLTAGAALHPDAMRRTLAAIAEFAPLAKRVGQLFVIGTHALRDASDAAEFARRVHEITGAQLRVLTGEEEARASFAGALWALEQAGEVPASLTVVDIGGGSTELAFRKGPSGAVHVVSLPLGAVSLKERFFKHDPPLATELTACRTALRLELERSDAASIPQGALVAVGGTADTAARMLNAYDLAQEVRVAAVRVDDIADLLRLTSSLPLDDRKRLHGLPESRADIFPAGLIILEEIAQRARLREITVTESDLLLGFMLQEIGT
jgi:exopolyphosphatase / guanosine-5'-triphosphate,3'-diphosphate pyrophosphatase